MIDANSRLWEPIETIELEPDEEDPTRCTHCQSRTVLIQNMSGGVMRESCAHCGQRFDVVVTGWGSF